MKTKSMRSGLMATTTICGLLTGALATAVVTGVTMLPTTALAQDLTNGTLSGTVKTSAGTPAADATVKISGQSTGFSSTVKTKADGTFVVNAIPTGTYELEITATDGSKTKESVLVALGSVSNYDFTTSSGTEVVVKGKARRNLDFNRTTVGQTISVQSVADNIPVARTLESIIDIVPGISINGVFGNASISGASPAENIYYVDGMNVTNFRNFLGGTTIPFDFYDQIEVKTAGYSAEYGRSTGGAIVATTRKGSNTFKGGVTYSYQPEAWGSKSAFRPSDLNVTPKVYTQDWAGTEEIESTFWLSGPLLKDHVYFFSFYNNRDLSTAAADYNSVGGFEQKSVETKTAPFWGGTMSFLLNPDQRLDWTYFTDDQTAYTHYFLSDGSDAPVLKDTGGLTRILKYTGKFTDWFTLSALYGSSSYNQTTSSTLDAEAAVYENGNIVRGNQELLVESGKDLRKNYRIDADFYYDFFGKHHTRIGVDKEELHADNVSQYSGGTYYRYYAPGTGGTISCGGYATTTSCVRVRQIFSGGAFDVENTSNYIQDDWTVTDRLNVNIGLRWDSFDNKNAAGASFLKAENLFSPRLGVAYDLFGDKTTKLTAFAGRYYLPIAANTNIRLAGGESFTEKYYTYTGRNATTLVPTLGTWLNPDPADYVLSDGTVPSADTLVSNNLKPQYEDEYSFGATKRFDNGWTFGVNLIYRELKNVLEDADLSYLKTDACTYLGISSADCGTFGGSGYVLLNPGKDVVIKLGDSFGGTWAGKTVTIPGDVAGFPEAKRSYQALQFSFDRADDGKWALSGSAVLSRTYGNIEGGVKSDNAQDDTGLTQDFDEVGWTDGSSGLLPNHHGYSFKLQGLYHFTDRLQAGFNAKVLSPRKYGCIGFYPYSDGRASGATLTAWYCDGKLTPRGRSFEGDWINSIDLSVSYKYPTPVGDLRAQLDLFNVLNAQGATSFNENGEYGGSGTPALAYKTASGYQTPRYARVTLKYAF